MSKAEPIAATLARGALSGVAGTVVMTGFQTYVEMPITSREESYAPADLARRLGIKVRRRHRRRVNYVTHFALGAGWGLARAAAARVGLRGQPAVGAVFGAMWPGDVAAATALGLEKPWRWSGRDWAIDVVDKLVLAEATGLAFDRLEARSHAAAS